MKGRRDLGCGGCLVIIFIAIVIAGIVINITEPKLKPGGKAHANPNSIIIEYSVVNDEDVKNAGSDGQVFYQIMSKGKATAIDAYGAGVKVVKPHMDKDLSLIVYKGVEYYILTKELSPR